MSKKSEFSNLTDEQVAREISRLTRRSFATGLVAALAGGAGVSWLATRSEIGGLPWPLRKVLEFNEQVAETIYSPSRLAPEFPQDQAAALRVNGSVGLNIDRSIEDEVIQVTGHVDRTIPMEAIRKLPAREMTTEFKCVEGWSQIVCWKGVPLADFLDKFGAASKYVGLSTPIKPNHGGGTSERYFVAYDRASAVHPQTLLCYEMNGQPLTAEHGAPLRLISTVKYGYKCIKRVGIVELTDRRPDDYWALRGYDWYAGL
jgi:DMSO/TMAO reductase YedYZ molybdopterin-dependent catalytic subunit